MLFECFLSAAAVHICQAQFLLPLCDLVDGHSFVLSQLPGDVGNIFLFSLLDGSRWLSCAAGLRHVVPGVPLFCRPCKRTSAMLTFGSRGIVRPAVVNL